MQTWFGQPRGLTVLLLTEMWEKFSFFGMRALLVYYMVKHLHFEQGYASLVYGAYGAGVYLTPIVGAWVSDRWLDGHRRRSIRRKPVDPGNLVPVAQAALRIRAHTPLVVARSRRSTSCPWA